MEDQPSMPSDTKDALAVRDALRNPVSDNMDKSCLVCGAVLRKPRVIIAGTTVKCRGFRQGQHVDDVVPKRVVSWCWCSQACYDSWEAQYVGKIPGTAWPVYREGALIAYVVPGKGRVPLEEIEAARDGAA